MTPPTPDLRRIAHESLSLTEAPYLRHFRRGRFRAWSGVAFTGSCLPGPGFNFAACLGPTPPLDEIIPVAREFFADADKGWGILVEGDAGHPIEAEVKARGWTVDEDEPAFVMPVIRPPFTGGLESPPVNGGLSIRQIVSADEEAAFHKVTAAAFNAPPDFAALLLPATPYVTNPDITLFIGSCGEDDVAVVGYSRSGSTAVVWGTATLEPYRGRGYGAALIRTALAHASGRGCTAASLRSGPKSVPLYERLGFRYVCQHRTYAYPAT